MDKNIIFLGGINGTGKTTVANEVSKRTGIPFFEGSAELMKELNLKVGNYGELRRLSEKRKKEALEKLFKRISEINKNQRAIISGHFVKVLNGEVSPYCGDWFNYCSDLFHITSEPKKILERIKQDELKAKKSRAVEGQVTDLELFIYEAQIESLKVMNQAVKDYCAVGHIVNNDGDLENTINEICGRIVK